MTTSATGTGFCADALSAQQMVQKVGLIKAMSQEATVWARMDAESPTAIKPQMDIANAGIQKLAQGDVGAIDTPTYTTAYTTVAEWISQNCH